MRIRPLTIAFRFAGLLFVIGTDHGDFLVVAESRSFLLFFSTSS